MAPLITREQLHQQIDTLPEEVVEVIADFTFYIMSRRQIPPLYAEWEASQWQDFVLGQFFREPDDVEYRLEDAQEIYRP